MFNSSHLPLSCASCILSFSPLFLFDLSVIITLLNGAPAFHSYRPHTKFAKVMFLHLSVILFTGGGRGVYPSMQWVRPPRITDPPCGSASWEIRATSGRYASYRNAYLFIQFLENFSFLAFFFPSWSIVVSPYLLLLFSIFTLWRMAGLKWT